MLKHSNTATAQVQAGRQQTTLAIDAELWKRTKKRAIDEGLDARQVVELALMAYLDGPTKRKSPKAS